MEIRFVSSNKHKIREVEEILGKAGFRVIPVSTKIEELQIEDPKRLVRAKILRAFERIGRPVIVEHTGLYIAGLNNLPGGLTQLFWDRLQADKFVDLVRHLPTPDVVARTTIGYCDSKSLHFFEGEIAGTVPPSPRGPLDFQWDCVFIPAGENETFAEMGARKNEISMRRKALDALAEFLGRASSGPAN